MEEINVRYGESLDLTVSSDDALATEATLYVGRAGEPVAIIKSAFFELGTAFISLTTAETEIPPGEYSYQINVEHEDGKLEKYPLPHDCIDGGLPKFIVHEALDGTEVVS